MHLLNSTVFLLLIYIGLSSSVNGYVLTEHEIPYQKSSTNILQHQNPLFYHFDVPIFQHHSTKAQHVRTSGSVNITITRTTSAGPQPVPLASSFATLLGLVLECIAQPHGSLLHSDGGGYFWRLCPITGALEALCILSAITFGLLFTELSFRQTCLWVLFARTQDDEQRWKAHEEPGFGYSKTVGIASVIPVVLMLVRAGGTAGSRFVVAAGVMYFASWAAVTFLIVVDEVAWARYSKEEREAAVEKAGGYRRWISA